MNFSGYARSFTARLDIIIGQDWYSPAQRHLGTSATHCAFAEGEEDGQRGPVCSCRDRGDRWWDPDLGGYSSTPRRQYRTIDADKRYVRHFHV